MKKIVLVSNASWSMIKFRYGFMKALINNKYDVYVIAPEDNYSNEFDNLGCKYINIKVDNKGSNPLLDIKLIICLYKLYKSINPDLVIHYSIKPNIYGSFAAKLSGVKCFSIITGLGYTFINDNMTSKIAKNLYKIALKIPLKVWFINKYDKGEFLKLNLIDEKKTKLILGEGVDIRKFMPLHATENKEDIKFLLIARVIKDKGIYEYIEAIKHIKQKYGFIKFQILGSIYLLNPTSISKEEIMDWHQSEIIEYLGETNDVRKYISNATCIVLPSYREGLSMSLMEAASMEKPIITTDVPGCKEVVDDSINGYLCKPKDYLDLAKKIEKMINLSNEERMKMGRKSRKKVVEEFDEKLIIKEYLNEINILLDSD